MTSPNVWAATLVGLLAVSAQQESSGPGSTDLTGMYACEGATADGRSYQGVVEIVRVQDTYRLRWTLPPEEQYYGIAILTGDVLAVSVVGRVPSVVAYRIEQVEGGQHLIGQWTVLPAGGQVFGEKLTKLTRPVSRPPDPEPRQPRSPIKSGTRA
jgi:hypothetical protein